MTPEMIIGKLTVNKEIFRHLLRGTDQQQIGGIGTGDEQHKADCSQ